MPACYRKRAASVRAYGGLENPPSSAHHLGQVVQPLHNLSHFLRHEAACRSVEAAKAKAVPSVTAQLEGDTVTVRVTATVCANHPNAPAAGVPLFLDSGDSPDLFSIGGTDNGGQVVIDLASRPPWLSAVADTGQLKFVVKYPVGATVDISAAPTVQAVRAELAAARAKVKADKLAAFRAELQKLLHHASWPEKAAMPAVGTLRIGATKKEVEVFCGISVDAWIQSSDYEKRRMPGRMIRASCDRDGYHVTVAILNGLVYSWAFELQKRVPELDVPLQSDEYVATFRKDVEALHGGGSTPKPTETRYEWTIKNSERQVSVTCGHTSDGRSIWLGMGATDQKTARQVVALQQQAKALDEKLLPLEQAAEERRQEAREAAEQARQEARERAEQAREEAQERAKSAREAQEQAQACRCSQHYVGQIFEFMQIPILGCDLGKGTFLVLAVNPQACAITIRGISAMHPSVAEWSCDQILQRQKRCGK